MSAALFLLVVIAVFGGVPLVLPLIIRSITENRSEKASRKESKRVKRIELINVVKIHFVGTFKRIVLKLQPGEFEKSLSYFETKIISLFKRAKKMTKVGMSRIARCLDPEWGTSIILGGFLVFCIYEYAPPSFWRAVNATGILAPISLIGLLMLMPEPFPMIAKAIYYSFFAAAIAGAAAIIYWLLFHKPAPSNK